MTAMTLANRIRMIPRYNWDFGFIDLCKALAGALRAPQPEQATLRELYGERYFFTTSGRASLYTILRSLGLPKGAGVGVPLFCCSVVFDAILQAGYRPRFLDIVQDTYTLSPEDIVKKRRDLSAIIAVHMFGHPADMDAVLEAAGTIPVIEDCAQSLFCTYKGRYAGTMGTASFFSFRSGKYISAGEGSAIVCATPALSDAVRSAIASFPKWRFGQSAMHSVATYIKSTLYHRPWYGTVGLPLGSRLDRTLNLTAKSGFTLRQIAPTDLHVIDERLNMFRANIGRQRENALCFLQAIKRDDVILPVENSGCTSNFYQFAIRMKNRDQRDRLAAHLLKSGIDAAKYLDGITAEARASYGYNGHCPVAEHCSQSVLTIPVYYSLSQGDVTHIADSINRFAG
jgi:perosamine synthetase